MTKRRTERLIPAAIVVAVFGILAVQVVLIDMAYRAADRAFGQNVQAALQAVAQELEARELVTTFLLVQPDSHATSAGDSAVWTGQTRVAWRVAPQGTDGPDSAGLTNELKTRWLQYSNQSPQRLEVTSVGTTATRCMADTVLGGMSEAGRHAARPAGRSQEGAVRYHYETTNESLHVDMTGTGAITVMASQPGRERRTALITRFIDRLQASEREPVTARLSAGRLDSLLHAGLVKNSITLPYTFGVAVAGADTLAIAGPGATGAVLASPYRTRLFPADILAQQSELYVAFPGEGWYLFRQVGPYAVATLVFAALIILGAVSAFRTIARQERLSAQVRDFINNMVHEFKTPLSTITLASEAIVRPDVIAQRTRIRRYTGVIREETARMRDQVAKILQMAVVEEGDYELTLKPLDLHALLGQAAGVFAIQVESRGGSLTVRPDAGRATVRADAMHLTNIVHNILENALKYTQGAPVITVVTASGADTVVTRFTDNGIGMTAEDARRVFDKYFRVPKGNIHEVKGFGLGLAYVRLMVTAMGGTVGVESTPGAGTTIIVTLPLADGEAA